MGSAPSRMVADLRQFLVLKRIGPCQAAQCHLGLGLDSVGPIWREESVNHTLLFQNVTFPFRWGHEPSTTLDSSV